MKNLSSIKIGSIRIKITDKKRFAAFCAALALIISAGLFSAFMPAGNARASEGEYALIYVGEGDTLWSIVRENYPDNTDIREKIHDIKSINDMTSCTIYPGDELFIPVY